MTTTNNLAAQASDRARSNSPEFDGIKTQASDEPMRAAFEAWAELSEYRKRGIQHDLIGWYYHDSEIDARWDAWKAAIATSAAPQSSGNSGELAPRATADVELDAARFLSAIALDDNAAALYAAVLSYGPDGAAIREAFDSDIAATKPGETT